MMNKKGDLSKDTIIGILLVLAFLVLVLIIYGIASGKMSAWVGSIKNFLRFGG